MHAESVEHLKLIDSEIKDVVKKLESLRERRQVVSAEAEALRTALITGNLEIPEEDRA